ncbi:cupredoxin domain-containing protein [Methanosarcina mazei]|uniref:Cell surface lipoprotein n=1 Tax=Methanosarcina mazei SarPi TaxID=1434115 RepID=A0A0E3LRL1_METMZ|nr:cell surface lipoprotein [Methanosarcina mazei]AKB60211.1 Cell surface lipoprotein [Methanosarcina mazei SarPi]
MKGKILVLLLVFVFLFASGCAGEDSEAASEESDALEASAEPQDDVQQENVSSGSGKNHIIYIEYYNETVQSVTRSELDISAGDTVSWWSKKRQGTYILVSEEDLFPDQELTYRVPYSYTFNKPGSYLFTVKDVPEMNVTIRVN